MGIKDKPLGLKTPEEVVEIINTNVQILCDLNKISLQDLSDEIGVGKNYFTRSRSDMPISKIVAVANVFGVKPETLYDESYTTGLKVKKINEDIRLLEEARKALENE